MTRAEKSIAMVILGGIPKESMGIMVAPAAELLADAGPATPSIAPFPNLSGCLETFFSTAYETKEERTGPPPGKIPRNNPMKDPLTMAHFASAQSFKDGHRFRTRA